MNEQNIINLESLIPLPKGHKIIGQKSKNLTAPGDNYGSLMLKLDITVAAPDGTVKEINTAAKLVPPNEFVQKLFNTQVTFRNEIGFYSKIVPILQKFQRECGIQKVIDFTPKYYGSRLNLANDDGGRIDSNAALILENLKLDNYVNIPRTIGFDLDGAKLVMEDLAHLHAVPLALKIQKKDVFDQEIMPYLAPWHLDENYHQVLTGRLRKIIESLEEITEYADRAMESFRKIVLPLQTKEPWGTITHNDCWVNNTMVKIEEGKLIKNKIVDYQICDYGSPGRDLVFFLFSSVQSHVVEEHYDELLKLYHITFTRILQELGCDTKKYSLENLEKEMAYEAENSQFGHIAFMLHGIFASEEEVRELSEDLKEVPPTEQHIEKLIFVVKEFVKRNWI